MTGNTPAPIRCHVVRHPGHTQNRDLPVLILLHGFMGSGEDFNHVVEPLKAVANPVTVDLPGHGKSKGSADPSFYHPARQADALAEVIQSFNNQKIYLHGYSMGGRLALYLALTRPGLANGLILESTAFGLAGQQEREERNVLDEERARALETDFSDFLASWKRLPLFNGKKKIPDVLLKTWESIRRNQNPAYLAGCLRGFGAGHMPYMKVQLPALQMPVLLIAGETDTKYAALAREMNDIIPDSRLTVAEGTGHRVHLEYPEAFIEAVITYIKTVK